MPDETPATAPDPALARLARVDLNLLVPLLALLEERSVTQAARKVGMTQSALSHSLTRMRRLFGDRLLVREGMRMVPTPYAERLLEPLQQALRASARVVNPGRFDPATTQRRFVIGMTNSIAVLLAEPLTRLITERAPLAGITIRTMVLAVPDDAVFSRENLDVLLQPSGIASKHAREPLFGDSWVVVTRRDAAPVRAADLITSLPHVAFDTPGYRAEPYAVLDAMGVPYDIRHTVSDNVLVPHVVAGTGGVGFHRSRVAGRLGRGLDLRVTPFPHPVRPPSIDLIWNPWLMDATLQTWLRTLLGDAVAATS